MPDNIDISFLKDFKELLEEQIKTTIDKRFVLITGGGKTARKYQEAAKQVVKLDSEGVDSEDIDWLGIHATRINAHLLRTIFKKHAFSKIIKDPTKPLTLIGEHKIVVAAGWKPSFSTDYDAVLLAKNLGSKKIINLTNIDYVYDKDPNKFKDAKIIEKIFWKEFRELIPKEWSPGLNAPFDPVASKEAETLGLEVAIINGKNLAAIKNCIEEKEFKGTKIS